MSKKSSAIYSATQPIISILRFPLFSAIGMELPASPHLRM